MKTRNRGIRTPGTMSALGDGISRDPIGERGGRNLYGFVFNNPIRYSDKLGLETTFAGFGEVDWTHSQPWDPRAIADSLCPFRCNGHAYNPFTHCCCKGKLLSREKKGTGVYQCDIPLSHSWIYIKNEDGTGKGYGFYSKNYHEHYDSGSSTSVTDAFSGGKVVDDAFNPEYCREIKLSPCKYDLAKFRQLVIDYWKQVEEKGKLYLFPIQDCVHVADTSVQLARDAAKGCSAE